MTSTVIIVGNLTRDPDLRFTPTGQANAGFGVAVNRRWQNRQPQDWEEATSFFDVVTWAGLAENVAHCLKRGDRVVVEGRLDQRSWENQEGDKRSKVEITANESPPPSGGPPSRSPRTSGRPPRPSRPATAPATTTARNPSNPIPPRPGTAQRRTAP